MEPPAGTTTLAGALINAELELIVRVVFVVAGCDKDAVQTLVTPVIAALGEHVNELTPNPTNSWMFADLEEPLYDTATEPV